MEEVPPHVTSVGIIVSCTAPTGPFLVQFNLHKDLPEAVELLDIFILEFVGAPSLLLSLICSLANVELEKQALPHSINREPEEGEEDQRVAAPHSEAHPTRFSGPAAQPQNACLL